MGWLTRCWLRFVVWLNAHCKSVSVRLTYWTKKSPVPLHPKHLAEADPDRDWYLTFVGPNSLILDAGCGSGMHSLHMARAGHRVLAIDRDHATLCAGQRLIAANEKPLVTFAVAHLGESIPTASSAFDAVLLLDVIEHLVTREQLLREIYRVLRPEGKLLISAPNRDTRWKRRLRSAGLPAMADPDHKVEYTWDELVTELRGGGFRVVAGPFPIVYDTPWAGIIDLLGGISLSAYRKLALRKVAAVRRSPQETTGWRIVCERMDSE